LKNKTIKLPLVTKNKNTSCHSLAINSVAVLKLKTHLVHNKPVANPGLELRENGFVLLALPTFLPSVTSSFFYPK